MKPIYLQFAGALALTFAIAACVPAPAPTPAPTPVATASPPPPPPPAPAPTYTSWMDAPKSPGNWSYTTVAGGSRAVFGENAAAPAFALACDAAGRRLALTRYGSAAANALTVRTEEATRALATRATPDRTAATAEIAASDPLLDAMALTKGRFAIEAAGAPTLYLPAWAEVTRVIEDCR